MSYRITSDCKQCGVCQTVCPVGAIVKTDETYLIIADKCKSCGACAEQCPRGAITFSEDLGDVEFARISTQPPQHGDRSRRHCHHAGHEWRSGNRFVDWLSRLLWPMGEGPGKPGKRAGRKGGLGRCRNRRRRSECHGRNRHLNQYRMTL